MKVYNYKDMEAKDAEEGALKLTVRWLVTKEMGAENFAMRLFEMEAGGYSPFHSHPWEHEVFILEGEGLAKCSSSMAQLRQRQRKSDNSS